MSTVVAIIDIFVVIVIAPFRQLLHCRKLKNHSFIALYLTLSI